MPADTFTTAEMIELFFNRITSFRDFMVSWGANGYPRHKSLKGVTEFVFPL